MNLAMESPSSSEFIGAMTETLADPEGMREDAIKHPSLIPSVRRSS
jgi:hypothetical protein